MRHIIRSGTWLARALLLVAAISFSEASSQLEPSQHRAGFIACDVEKCGFAVQSEDTAEIRFVYNTHAVIAHQGKLTSERLDSLTHDGTYVSNQKDAKSIACPFGDGFVIWPRSEDELAFHFSAHSQVVNDKQMSKEDIAKLIR